MNREVAISPSRQAMLAMFAAVAFFGAANVAQAQSTTTGPSTSPSASSTMTAQSGTAGSPTQVNPNAQDSNRQASQGMVPSPDESSAQSRIGAPNSDLRNDRTTMRNDRTTMRNDRTTMARAPRADRN